ncbi:restriction endonuclease subunit S [Xylella fastidiosa]|uniref:restriction endonuclease subunit S n=1 Tax=Xylella fastidiosa TaxID=2371 RepID=UPI00292EC61F|nr:restriction endonuclease subunit S [Xylella fastidiosa]WNY19065.1 restriction endonuclease subunit S [Xylella fastidiosa]
MSRIDELIAALCPEGVEFKRLGEIFDMKAGKFISSNEISKNQDEHFLYPCYGGNGIRGFVRQNNQEGKYILIGRQGALCGNVKRTQGKFFATEHAVVCDSKVEVDMDWAFHLLSVINLNQYATKSAQPGLAVRTIEQVKVPLPPLEVQRQIVKVLDTFTTLEAELEARRRQYQYYRDALLTFGEGTDASGNGEDGAERNQWKPTGINWIDELIAALCPEGVEFKMLGELLDYEQSGKYLVASTAYDNSYWTPVLTAGQTFILGYTDETSGIYPASPQEPVIIFDDFTTAFKWVDFPFKAKSSAMKILRLKAGPLDSLRYVFFAMQTITYKPQDHARQWIGTYSKFLIPVPPLEVQARIVAVLDQFDTLVNDITAGLPAEIAARRQQYAYYRDRLLTFKEAV